MSIDLLIIRNRVKLEKLITEDKEYSKILKQSQKLDKLINKKMGISVQKHYYPKITQISGI
ncbi:MAG: Spo0E family sporulation regulatory protein-aspartic acid phosphatase [Clostridia bacterium]|nr:Spo0E family sporulation regulatory protein-aspartic acid phosphatase [Clostridia bacterium]